MTSGRKEKKFTDFCRSHHLHVNVASNITKLMLITVVIWNSDILLRLKSYETEGHSDFLQFHRENAELQLLCEPCHKAKTKNW